MPLSSPYINDEPLYGFRAAVLFGGENARHQSIKQRRNSPQVNEWIDNASVDSAADDRIAIQVVLMCKEKTLKYTFVRSTFEEWDCRDEELVVVLQKFKPLPYAPLVLIKVLTEQMVRDLGKSESNDLNSVQDPDTEIISETQSPHCHFRLLYLPTKPILSASRRGMLRHVWLGESRNRQCGIYSCK